MKENLRYKPQNIFMAVTTKTTVFWNWRRVVWYLRIYVFEKPITLIFSFNPKGEVSIFSKRNKFIDITPRNLLD